MTTYNQRAHDDYIQSGRWKCDKSPTGAHYWIGNQYMLKCKYCGKEKQVMETITPLQAKARERAGKHALGNKKL